MPSATDNGFPSPRHDAFPAGLRVLVVDDDPTWLKILEKMLKKCSYEVTTCGLARDALHLLRERKDGYDIVISDVNMPDMDGFKLLEHVGLEMDLPVIMMSVDGETSRVMKGVQHGACDYLLKPIRMKELRNIWQHVLRKKIHDLRDIEGIEVFDMTRSGSERSDDGFFFCGEDVTSGKKRKDWEGNNYDKDFVDPSSSTKKARVVWSVDLHQKFVKAVNQIGFDKVGPKKILDLMNVPWLTRENVASHLQKYRLYLTRLQKDTDLKTCFTGLKETTPQDPQSCFSNQNSINGSSSSFAFAPNNLLFPNMNQAHEDDHRKGRFQIPKEEPKRVLVPEAPDQLDSRGFGFKAPFQQLASSQVRYPKVDPTVPMHYAWTGTQEIPFSEEKKREDLKRLALPQARVVDPQPCRVQRDKTTSAESKTDCRSKSISQEIPVRTRTGHHFENYHQDVVSNPPAKKQIMENDAGFNPTCVSVCGLVFGSSNEDIQSARWLPENINPINLGLEFSEFNDPEFPINLFDAFRYDYEQQQQFAEPTECSVLGQGLFMA